jgi:dihydrofolate reductase
MASLEDADAWHSMIRSDAMQTVSEAEGRPYGHDLGLVGSASLVRSLHAAELIDRYTLVIPPITLSYGARMFEVMAPLTRFTLTGSVVTANGVIVAHYDWDGKEPQ